MAVKAPHRKSMSDREWMDQLIQKLWEQRLKQDVIEQFEHEGTGAQGAQILQVHPSVKVKFPPFRRVHT